MNLINVQTIAFVSWFDQRESTSKRRLPVTKVHTFQFNWAADTMTNYATALHIFFFAALRYITICHSSQFTINSFPRIKVCFRLFCVLPLGMFYQNSSKLVKMFMKNNWKRTITIIIWLKVF